MQTNCRKNFDWAVMFCCDSLFHVGLLLMFISIVSVCWWMLLQLTEITFIEEKIWRSEFHLGLSCLFYLICWCPYRKSRIENWNWFPYPFLFNLKSVSKFILFGSCFLNSNIFTKSISICSAWNRYTKHLFISNGYRLMITCRSQEFGSMSK